ncbi:MAG: hypothetical protein E6Q97_04300 [Desulfurellales bacterium]|nr:MAG: hypothetical protein E6Q97_04300 [Desulfurellales bacterium]
MSDLVEAVARGLVQHDCERPPKIAPPWSARSKAEQEIDLGYARAALSAIEAYGYVIVPREPTSEMIDAALLSGFEGERRHLVKDYAAMISAAPKVVG